MFNTLDSYGESQGAFLMEGETSQTTDSSYTRHVIGGQNNAKKDEQKTNGIIRISED